MGSYATGRAVFLARSLGTAQSVRSAALIGEGVAAPTDGVALNDIKLTEFEEIILSIRATFAYTGGTTDPNLQVRVQRKFAQDLPDSDDTAWEDIASFANITGSITDDEVVRLGLQVLTTTNIDATAGAYSVSKDALAAGNVRTGHPGEKIRIRETVAGGDRTGGNLTYDLRLLGIAVG